MKIIFSALFTVATVLASVQSCGRKDSVPQSLQDVRDIVAQLDSAVTAMYGWEPGDSTYNRSHDTLFAAVIDQYQEEYPESGLPEDSGAAVQQRAYDEARLTWAAFKRLCDGQRYGEALDFYLGKGDDYVRKNAGDILVFLKHSSCRFMFYSRVLLPLMKEYRGEAFANGEYIKVLELEKVMEDGTVAMAAGGTGYVPRAYPYVLRELGEALVSAGRMGEAQDLFDDYADAIHMMTGDALYANFSAVYFSAHMYMLGGSPTLAAAAWYDFRDYLDNHKDEYNPHELEKCFERIEEEQNGIRKNSPRFAPLME